MTPAEDPLWQRWDEVDQLLDEALDRPPDERAGHVAARAGHDPILRDLVQRLLARLEEDGGDQRVSGPAPEIWRQAFPGAAAEEQAADIDVGTRVGHYVIVGRRGRGGMATVYEAERSDGAYQQRVALKVLRRGLDTDDLIRRFLTERQILSSLSHPNIARLLDGGALADGRPYLVMELVDGQKITTYADAANLDVRARLQLVIAVAGAVHAAHRHLVVHRDIKPSNILVDAEGQPKLLDFGIAKLLAADTAHTDAGARALTPDYASPEQIRGDPITTGSDVYQLGLLTRELLAGASSPARTAGGDLEIIVGKALRADPAERYGSAEELAADIRRHLAGFPIHAHPESARYRFHKFTGRYPLFVPGALAAVVALLGFITTLSVQNRRIAAERDAARAATERAVATQNFLVDLLRSPDPTAEGRDRDITVVDAMQRGRARVADELSGQPALRAALLLAMGQTFSGLGRFDTADTLLRASLALHESLYGEADVQTTNLLNAIGSNYRFWRWVAPADSVLQLELLLRMRGPVPDTALARMLSALSATRRDLGDTDSALVLATKAVALLRAAGDTTRSVYTAELGMLAYALRGADQLDSAEAVYREVLRRQQGDSTAVAVTHNNLGYLLRLRGDYPGAERHYREAVRILSKSLGDGHATTLMVSSNLAGVLVRQGRVEEVLAIGRTRIAAVEREWPDGHWRVGAAYSAQGRYLLREGRAAEAIEPLAAGVASYVATLGAGHTTTAVLYANQGTAMVLAGRRAEGRRALDRAYGVLHGHPIALDAEQRQQINDMAAILANGGFPAEAARYLSLLADPKQP